MTRDFLRVAVVSLLLTAATLYGAILAASGAGPEDEKVQTVCEVIANLQTYSDRVVAIRGELGRTEHGSYLIGERCDRPLVTSGYTWRNPSAFFLTVPGSKFVDRPQRTDREYLADFASADLLKQFVRDTGARIFVTVIGRLEARSSYEMVLRGDGKMVPHGFGQLNAYPAQIVQRTIKDVVVKRDTPLK